MIAAPSHRRAVWPRRFADGRGSRAAVGAGDDVFSADEFSECDDAIGYQFRVLDEVGRMADDAGDEDFSGGQFHVVPDFVFVFVTDVSGFENVEVELC